MHIELSTAFLNTPYGKFEITASKRGLVKIDFPSARHSKRHCEEAVGRRSNDAKHLQAKILLRAKSLLKDYFSGSDIKFNKIPIDWRIFSPFDQRVCRVLRKIPAHQIVTYSELARRAQVPKAARAVGNAMNRNPIPIVIPCHRVVRKDRTLGGYSAGLRWKRILLNLEQGEV